MNRRNGPYFVDGSGFCGQGRDSDIIDFNEPPPGQPGLWCKWIPSEDGTYIEWDGGEKFYDSAEWMQYIIEHFIGSSPLAKDELPFLEGHVCSGLINAQGEDPADIWAIQVANNAVSTATCTVTPNDFVPLASTKLIA
jgi:hypothetical protein